jgi:YrhK-like protein
MGIFSRLCRRLEARWAVSAANILSAALFVAGSVGFFWSGLDVASVSFFLAGSLLYLFSALAGTLLEHGPTGRLPRQRDSESAQRRRGTPAKSHPDTENLVA